jgi:hypothetical protein
MAHLTINELADSIRHVLARMPRPVTAARDSRTAYYPRTSYVRRGNKPGPRKAVHRG